MDVESMLDGRYRLLDRLGAGGMSVVWRAHDEVLGRDVAVKLLSPELAADPQLLHRTRAEARSAARLRHPNIVEVYDYGEATDAGGPPVPYVVMEVVEGRSLSQLLTGGPLPWRVAVLICAQVAAALAAAHRRGVVHRDVKPGNVMVAGGGVKLVDFGISATSGDPDGLPEGLLGTPAYLAPSGWNKVRYSRPPTCTRWGCSSTAHWPAGCRGGPPPPPRWSPPIATTNRPRCRTSPTCLRRSVSCAGSPTWTGSPRGGPHAADGSP